LAAAARYKKCPPDDKSDGLMKARVLLMLIRLLLAKPAMIFFLD
jgi:hypothetical protein